MSKILGALKFVWKNNKVWLFVSTITMIVVLTLTLIATQNSFLANTISTVFGGERRVLVSGDPSKYQYYDKSTDAFIEFDTDIELTGSASKQKELALKMANNLNESIAEEGFVLLKNDNEALPLTSTEKKISVFGKNSVNLVYGGSGSGGMDSANNIKLHGALETAGFTLNKTLQSFYDSNKESGKGRESNPAISSKGLTGFATGETPVESYYASVKDSFSEYNDAALVVFSRIGGEGFDLPRTMAKNYGGSAVTGANSKDDHYLQLDKNEQDLLEMVCGGGFKKVIVVINCSTSMELDFIKTNDKINAAIWVGSPGGTGISALGSILNGSVNPSGRLVDTYAKDFTKDPTYTNFGDNKKTKGNTYLTEDGNASDYYFVEYEESLYMGYRYYETRAYDESDFGNDDWYGENVVYPFGYGESYTTFKWEIVSNTSTASMIIKDGVIQEDEINIDVKVTNTGKYPGKDVVQLYYTSPYYEGEIEKAQVVLGDFVKTKELAAYGDPDGKDQQIVSLSIKVTDMSSYDYNDANNNDFYGYELDEGNYAVRIGKNAHQSWADNSNALKLTYTVGDGGYQIEEDSETGTVVENLFDDVSDHYKSGNSYSLFTRKDFRGSFPDTPTIAERTKSPDFFKSLEFVYDDESAQYFVEEDDMPNQGVIPDDGVYTQLYELIQKDENGQYFVDYEDERWEEILDAITISEMINLIGTGNFNTARIDSIGKPKTTDPDGPAGFTNFMEAGSPTVYDTCSYASECVIGATWNKNLAHDMGIMIGLEGLIGNARGDERPYSGWYAPAANIHRSPFSGRNWEYYSEDPLLSGITGANVVIGAQKKGVYTFVKHFAINDQETNRDSNGLITWTDEQTMREIYLKPFEIIVKVGKTQAMMSSFNRIGTVWAGGSYALLTELLRNEWGFQGVVISDYNVSNAYMHPDQMIRAGGDLNLTQSYMPSSSGTNYNATHISAMRAATKNILYIVAGSNAMNGMGEGVVYRYSMPMWMLLLIIANIVIFVGFAVWGFFAIRRKIKKLKKAN